MLAIRPPTHKIDAVGVFVARADTSWDTARIEAEIAAAIERSDAAKMAEPGSSVLDEIRDAHPVVRYYRGLTRYQLDAPDHDLTGAPTTARQYLLGEPTEFVLQRLSWDEMERIASITTTRLRWSEYVRKALGAIRGGDLQWTRTNSDVPPAIMQTLWDNGVLLELGIAAYQFSAPLMEHEGKR